MYRKAKIAFKGNSPYIDCGNNNIFVAIPKDIINYVDLKILKEGSQILIINNHDMVPFIEGKTIDVSNFPKNEKKYYLKIVWSGGMMIEYFVLINDVNYKYSWMNIGALLGENTFIPFEECLSKNPVEYGIDKQELYMFNSAQQLFEFYSKG